MSFSNKRKKATEITFSRTPAASSLTSNQSVLSATTGGTLTTLLREKTSIRQDGRVAQEHSIVAVTSSSHSLPPKISNTASEKTSGPVYELDTEADRADDFDGGDDDNDPRAPRASDDPLRQWVEDHREVFLSEMLRHEGRGSHNRASVCQCGIGAPNFRCIHCMSGGRLLCQDCIVSEHERLPFHSIQEWTGSYFERRTLKSLDLHIQLGHWNVEDPRCPLPEPAFGNDFVIIDTSGVHPVNLDFCGCGQGGHYTVQLLRARLWPSTTTSPRTAATFSVLRSYHLLSFESKCAALEFYQSLARQTDNLHRKKDKNRYQEFLRMTREWRHIQMLKRAARGHDPGGISATKPGECALLCPACPHPGLNLPPDWMSAAEDKQFLYALFLALDANFRLRRKDVSSEQKDPGLGKGWAFYCDVLKYMEHVKRNWKQEQDRSHCVAHDAVDKPDREARGTASSGVGAIDCARHNMKRPQALGDLQLGERYMNMDYMFFTSIHGSPLLRFVVSYDIACQWHIKIWERMLGYNDATLLVDGRGKFFTFLVPKFHLPAHIEECNLKFSFNLTRDVGQTDGEAPERGWANTNTLARSTKEMGPGHRRDILDDHWNDWNHTRIIALGYAMRRKVERAVPEMVRTRLALNDINASLGSEVVDQWTEMAERWEADVTAPNPFATVRKDQHVAKVRMELAEEAAAREAEGQEDEGAVRGNMHITELIAMGLQLEDQQRSLATDISATGLHPTDGQRRAMTERTSKLRRKIVAWIDIQHSFFPALVNSRAREDEERSRIAAGDAVPGLLVSSITLWLPSQVLAEHNRDVVLKRSVLTHEYRLRVGQAAESLHEVRRLLLVRTHLYKMKDVHARGVKQNTRSADKIAALNEQVKRAAATYRVARAALALLGPQLGRNEWEWSFLPLLEEDVRGLPQAMFHDPERKKKKKNKRARKHKQDRPISWIWVTRGERWEAGDDVAMNEAVRIEWAKTRARAMRWAEEVDLLEEEIRRIDQFLRWRADWWISQAGRRSLPEGPQLEGETAYALRQAAIQRTLATEFAEEWKGLGDLIRRGRDGQLEDEEAGDSGDDEGSEAGESGEEDEPISTLPAGTIKPTYTDEVLVM
ncbi:hypothetical protein R3P38DRAFT_2671570 [Favolaschia claudopus]|uniref:CxC2-like cysteine cluster KDZ transposase-associated domain-containing protein n=1 Tax=Favolaschia claudopus TaxID=2862362 RepID=A0AAV9Z3N8_9AGAR